jgi:hypothetical protein
MSSFRVRELKSTDTQALLAFEIDNREWFEAHIDARDPSFYSLQGVADHIEGYLADFAIGAWHPFVIVDSSETIGMCPGIPSCVTKPVATYAAAAPQYHSPAASAGA